MSKKGKKETTNVTNAEEVEKRKAALAKDFDRLRVNFVSSTAKMQRRRKKNQTQQS